MPNSFPLVSILIICYKQERFIKDAIEAALNQDYPNTEIVITDDNSPDATGSILKSYQEKYPDKIRVYTTETNLGVTGNHNHGLRLCKGEYLAMQGGDDVFLPGKISSQVQWLQEVPSRVICYHDMDVFNNETGETMWYWSERFKMRKGNFKDVIMHGAFMCGSSVMCKRSSCKEVYYDERIKISSDWLFVIDCLLYSKGSIGYLPDVYGKYRRHDSNVTSSSSYEFDEVMCTLNIINQKYPRTKSYTSFRAAVAHQIESKRLISKGDVRSGLKYFAKALIISPNGFFNGILKYFHRILGLPV